MTAVAVVIEPGGGGSYWAEAWRYRSLWWFLARRDALVRYRQTRLGLAWAVARPLAAMAVLTLVFSRIAGLSVEGVPYPLLVLSALLPWQLVASAVTDAGGSVLGHAALITKVYFPRVVLPLGALAVGTLDALVALAVLLAAMACYGRMPGAAALALPLFMALALAAAAACALWTAALVMRFRDLRHAIPFLLQLAFFVSPIGFASQLVPERWRLVYALDPLVGAIDGFRWTLLGIGPPHWDGVAVSALSALVALAGGAAYFRSCERRFADLA